jgi:hypothetical protein
MFIPDADPESGFFPSRIPDPDPQKKKNTFPFRMHGVLPDGPRGDGEGHRAGRQHPGHLLHQGFVLRLFLTEIFFPDSEHVFFLFHCEMPISVSHDGP